MEKDLKKYDEYINDVLKTWGGKHQLQRAGLGIADETGELIGKFKKKLRGDDVSDLDFKKEIGDILYYCRVYQHLNNLNININDFNNINTYKEEHLYFHVLLQKSSLFILHDFAEIYKKYFKSFLAELFSYIHFKSYSVEEILQINTEKLQSRKKRNKIKGNGDNR